MPNDLENVAEMPQSEADIEPSEAKTTRLELPEILTYDEIDRFLLTLEDIEDIIAGRIMLFAGLRVGEVAELRVKDIDPERCAVFVHQGKWGKDRWAPCDVSTIQIALSYAKHQRISQDNRLFSMSVRTIQRHMEDAYHRAGILWGPTCHTLRHTCATWQLDKGIPLEVVRENLGHEDIVTTQIYLHLNIRQRSRTYRDAVRFGL
jgi:integrase/recombinase XerD